MCGAVRCGSVCSRVGSVESQVNISLSLCVCARLSSFRHPFFRPRARYLNSAVGRLQRLKLNPWYLKLASDDGGSGTRGPITLSGDWPTVQCSVIPYVSHMLDVRYHRRAASDGGCVFRVVQASCVGGPRLPLGRADREDRSDTDPNDQGPMHLCPSAASRSCGLGCIPPYSATLAE